MNLNKVLFYDQEKLNYLNILMVFFFYKVEIAF